MLDLQALTAMSPANPSAASGTPCPPAWRCQTESRMSSAVQTMAFKNEVVSDADIDRYNLPFQKGDGRWWTRDAERDYYLWGGLSGNPAYGTEQEGWFYLYVEGQLYTFLLLPGEFSPSLKAIPYVVCWEQVLRILPDPTSLQHEKWLLSILKEALTEYGLNGENTMWPVETKVKYNF
jgi:hypothetical protein